MSGCANMSEREQGTAKGAGIGAVAGAVVGAATGGKAGTGAVVGGALGAIAGNLWSKRMEDKRVAMERATQGTGIDVARTTNNELKVNVPSDFSFDVGRAAVKPAMHPVLDQFAQGLDPNMRVRIVGHTDNTGSDAVNTPVGRPGQQRARLPGGRGVSSRPASRPPAAVSSSPSPTTARRRARAEPSRRDLPARDSAGVLRRCAQLAHGQSGSGRRSPRAEPEPLQVRTEGEMSSRW